MLVTAAARRGHVGLLMRSQVLRLLDVTLLHHLGLLGVLQFGLLFCSVIRIFPNQSLVLLVLLGLQLLVVLRLRGRQLVLP